MTDIQFSDGDRETMRRAIEAWGDKQYGMAIEELAETIVAINRFQRGRVPFLTVVQEFADAVVCVGQLLEAHKATSQLGFEVATAFGKLAYKLDQSSHNASETRESNG